SNDTVNRGGNFRVAKIDLSLFHRRFVRFDVCFAGAASRCRSISLLVANHLFVEQIDRALLIRFGLYPIGLVFGFSSLGLSQRSLERPRIDLKKKITLFDDTAFLVIP